MRYDKAGSEIILAIHTVHVAYSCHSGTDCSAMEGSEQSEQTSGLERLRST